MSDVKISRPRTKILHPRGTEEERKSISDILEEGEIFYSKR